MHLSYETRVPRPQELSCCRQGLFPTRLDVATSAGKDKIIRHGQWPGAAAFDYTAGWCIWEGGQERRWALGITIRGYSSHLTCISLARERTNWVESRKLAVPPFRGHVSSAYVCSHDAVVRASKVQERGIFPRAETRGTVQYRQGHVRAPDVQPAVRAAPPPLLFAVITPPDTIVRFVRKGPRKWQKLDIALNMSGHVAVDRGGAQVASSHDRMIGGWYLRLAGSLC